MYDSESQHLVYEGITKNQKAIMSTIKKAIKIVFIFSSISEFISLPPFLTIQREIII